ncbi:MAG TPA: glycosyltransferase family 39 protein [Anaeromyxobacter sp.]|nr:glycosyltransferase family 39 protein [Anaeromyxobacter sp.]
MTPQKAPDPDLSPSPALERWLLGHRALVLSALLLCAALLRLLLCAEIAGGPLPAVHRIVTESDGAFFERWGERIAAGDLLQRSPFHPTYAWMRAVAEEALAQDPTLPDRLEVPAPSRLSPAALEESVWGAWLGGATFYQEPAYPYLLGLTEFLAGPGVWHVFAWQLSLGVLGVLLLYELARRLASETAALFTGLIAVLAPVPLVYEVSLLRDGLVLFVTIALAFMMHWASGRGRLRLFALGVAFGAALLVKESFLFFPLSFGALRALGQRGRQKDALLSAGVIVAGMALPLLPLLLRNLAVGVSPLALNGSARAMLAVYHARSASPVDLVVGPEYAGVLLESDGRLLSSLAAAARTHSSALGFISLELSKLAYAFHPFEAPNNVDPYLFRRAAPLLSVLPASLFLIVPLAAVGLASRRAGTFSPLFPAILSSLLALLLGTVLSRYRVPLAVLLFPLAGAGVARLAGWGVRRRVLPIAALSLLSLLYLAFAARSPPGQSAPERAHRYALAGIDALSRGESRYAVLCLSEARALEPKNPRIGARLGQALLLSGDTKGALREVETAARSFDSSALRELHSRALATAGRRGEALEEARAAVSLDPKSPSARALLDLLQSEKNERAPGPLGEEKKHE